MHIMKQCAHEQRWSCDAVYHSKIVICQPALVVPLKWDNNTLLVLGNVLEALPFILKT